MNSSYLLYQTSSQPVKHEPPPTAVTRADINVPGFPQKSYDPFTQNDTTSPAFQPPPPTRRPPPVPMQQPGMTISSLAQRPLEIPSAANMGSPAVSQSSSRNNNEPMQGHNSSVAQSGADTNASNEVGARSPGIFAALMGRAPRMTKNGKQQKKRGPKTDSKPALNSKQEKNRQAQRNHRERVAAYTMTVEKEANRAREALRLTEHALSLANNENAALTEENRKLTHQNDVLTQLLRVNNIGVPNFSTTSLSSNSQQGSSRVDGSRTVTEATHSSNHQQGSPYGGNSNGSQNALGGFSPNGSGLSPTSSGYPFVHGGIIHDVGAQQNGYPGGSHTSPSSGNNPYAQDFAGNQLNYPNDSAFAATPFANTNYDSPYASTNHNSSQTHVPVSQFEVRTIPQQSHAFTQGHAHPTPAPSIQTPYAASPYASTNHHSSPEESQVNQYQVPSMQMPPPNGHSDYQTYPAMNITIQSPYFNNETSDQQPPIPDAAPYGPISFTNVSKYEASHPAEVAQWRLLMPDIDEPEMTREFAIPFILDLESGCRDHVAFMINRSNEAAANPNPTSHNEYNHNGHGLMVSSTHWHSLVNNGSDIPTAAAMDQSDLNFIESLINSADQIPLRGEMTPVQAWTWMKQQRGRADWLCNEDWEKLWKILKAACRCYGFGAVVEKYEVENAMHEVYCARHPEMNREWE